jgi:MFS transporter, DHA1 family, multidrug resistance protein
MPAVPPRTRVDPGPSGWRRVLWVMFAAQLLSAVGFSTIFPFLPSYVEHLGSTTGASLLLMVTLVFSLQAIAMAVASPIWGALSDRWGRKPMVERALYGGALLILLMGFARSAEELVALRLVQGLVTGVMTAGTSLVAAVVPRERLGYAMGVMQTGLWAGVSIGPVIGGILSFAFGYRVAFVLTALLLLVGGILVSSLVRERFVPAPGRGRGVAGMTGAFAHVLRAPGVASVLLVRFTAWLGRTMIMPFLPLFVAGLMAGAATAGIVTGLAIGAASALGTATSILFGRLGDRIGHRPVLLAGSVATAAVYLPMAFVTEAWQLVALYALTGATIGGVLPSISAMLAQLTERGEAGSVYGIDNAVVSAARGLSPVVGGAIVAAVVAGREPVGLDFGVVFLVVAGLFALTALLTAWRVPRAPSGPAAAAGDGPAVSPHDPAQPGTR